jgi:hypothetical protein
LKKRCERNRKRSKRRDIFCPVHGAHLDSVSQKYHLYAEHPEQLQQRGYGKKVSRLVIAQYGTVPVLNEWLEAFWCRDCQESRWYLVKKLEAREYNIELAPTALWEQVSGVISAWGNPSVGEFTRRQASQHGRAGICDFKQL